MIKAVIDTNIWISALLGSSISKMIKECLQAGKFQPVCSTQLLNELLEVLSRPKFAGKFTSAEAVELLQLVQQAALWVEVKAIEPISRDPKDDIHLACALLADCDFIVTGDNDLLVLKQYAKAKILTPANFLSELRSLI